MARKRNYTYRSMYEEREYGMYWYAGIWAVLRPVLIALATVVIVIGLLSGVWNAVNERYIAPVDAASQEEISFEVAGGSSLSRIARDLESAGLVRSSTVFKYYCDFAGMGQKLQAGTYSLRPSMTIAEIAERLTMGDGNPLTRNITLIPGWTVEDFAREMAAKGVVSSAEDLLSLCRTGEAFREYYYIADVLSAGSPGLRRYVLEGYLAPNTYEIYTDATPEDILRRLLSQTERAFPAEDQDRAEELGYSMDQMLTLASIIEKEAKRGDFARVSAVFHNRLKKGMPLGSDVTIHYITSVRKMALTDADLQVSSPYNTYTNRGLPVGPICNPSTEAIQAALYPDETFLAEGYLYFCAKEPESGELYFSKTQKEHDQAVAVYAPLWQAWDESRGIQ